ncbi:hypothetical protein BDN70DRAFT_899747 [Pholiota conissans]|uniref:Uncharacterized protein n=1 Tax=Pholiota conissans TaxID=109636 RepID=A0A9P5YPD3_9AGAR|nr:hypothetical protein BDN70DRAFT_899747 [Pholiota conissans]
MTGKRPEKNRTRTDVDRKKNGPNIQDRRRPVQTGLNRSFRYYKRSCWLALSPPPCPLPSFPCNRDAGMLMRDGTKEENTKGRPKKWESRQEGSLSPVAPQSHPTVYVHNGTASTAVPVTRRRYGVDIPFPFPLPWLFGM